MKTNPEGEVMKSIMALSTKIFLAPSFGSDVSSERKDLCNRRPS